MSGPLKKETENTVERTELLKNEPPKIDPVPVSSDEKLKPEKEYGEHL
jgi:hypothetical protein